MAKWLEDKKEEREWGEVEYPSCSNCFRFATSFVKTPFCPWCGTPMEIEKEEEK